MATPLGIGGTLGRLQTGLRRPWAASLALLAAAILVLGFLHAETARSIAGIWSSSATYAHGWLILPIAAWLAWRERARLASLAPRPSWPGLVAFAVVEALWIVASVADVALVQHFALVGLIPATVLALLGPAVARALAFPLGYLVFAVPWGEGFVPTLQDITAWMSVRLLELSQIPVFWEGRLISIPVGDFEVAEACSGVRYLIASLALGALYAYITYRSAWRRLAFLAAAAIVPIVANGLRAWGIIMLAHWSNMQLAVGVDHLIYGWVFFGFVIFLLFWAGSFFREQAARPAAATGGSTGARPYRYGASAGAGALAALAVLGLGASLTPGWLASAQPAPATTVALPGATAAWERLASADGSLRVTGFDGADAIDHAVYGGPSGRVSLLVVHYRKEGAGAELINSQNRLYGERWTRLGEGGHTVAVAGRTLALRELRFAGGGERRLLWTWYEVGGRQTASAPVAKLVGAFRRLTLQRGDATLVALSSAYDDQPARARRRLEAFLDEQPGVAAPRGLVREAVQP